MGLMDVWRLLRRWEQQWKRIKRCDGERGKCDQTILILECLSWGTPLSNTPMAEHSEQDATEKIPQVTNPEAGMQGEVEQV